MLLVSEMGACPKLVRMDPAAASGRISVKQHSLTTILHYHHLDLPKCLPEQVATIMSQTQVVQTDSMENDDPHSASEKKQKTRRPASAQDLCAMHCFAERISDIVARV
jgi:hypothetical protein